MKSEIVLSPDKIDALVGEAIFGANKPARDRAQREIQELAFAQGIYRSSIYGLYQAASKGLYHNLTVPAINIRGITYHVARAAFRAALKDDVGAFIFELARSEVGYTGQSLAEYGACVLAAAIREGFKGAVFLQGDHFQIRRSKYELQPETELNAVRELMREAVAAGFLNIDIDASTLVDLTKPTLGEQQAKNSQVTAEMTRFIRSLEPKGTAITIGGEIGEIGRGNSTVEDLSAFMRGYLAQLGPNLKGISKISVQTGTTHGGVVLPDGSIAQVELDFKTLEALSRLAREEYGMGGAVQHGASTLPAEAFGMFPQAGAVEVHLATGFQNIIYDSPYFPTELLSGIYKHLAENYASEKKPGDTEEQFRYGTRKRAFGDFKREIWSIPEQNLSKIGEELENRFTLLFQKLNVVNTTDLVNRYIAHRSAQG